MIQTLRTAGITALFWLAASTMVFAQADIDGKIEQAAKDSYVYKTYLKDDAIKVSSKEGKVTLTGTVNEESHKALAQETVAGLPGVTGVTNELTLKEAPAEANSDGWISMKVKAALVYHRNVSALNTKVYVKDGVVTLEGEADSQAQKDLTSEYASDIEGVKDVKNNMTVAAAPKPKGESLGDKIDDASITAQAKAVLLAHRSTSGFKTHIETSNGVVTVTGKAKSQAEKDLVTKLVGDVHGVNSVVNNMSVE